MAPQRRENAHHLFGGTCNHYLQGHVFKAKKWPDCIWLEMCLFRTALSGPIGIWQQHFDKVLFCSNSKVIWMVIIKNLGAKTDCYPHGPRHCSNPACLVAQIMSGFRPGSNDTNQTLHKTFQAFSVSFLFHSEKIICSCVSHLHATWSGINI